MSKKDPELHEALGITLERMAEISQIMVAEWDKTDDISLILKRLGQIFTGNELIIACFASGVELSAGVVSIEDEDEHDFTDHSAN